VVVPSPGRPLELSPKRRANRHSPMTRLKSGPADMAVDWTPALRLTVRDFLVEWDAQKRRGLIVQEVTEDLQPYGVMT
jgi:hypothetical protein